MVLLRREVPLQGHRQAFQVPGGLLEAPELPEITELVLRILLRPENGAGRRQGWGTTAVLTCLQKNGVSPTQGLSLGLWDLTKLLATKDI